MRKEDLFKKNHILGVEFDWYLLENPELLDQIPENAEVYFLPEEDPELSQENLKAAQAQKAKGGKSGVGQDRKAFSSTFTTSGCPFGIHHFLNK